MRHDDLSFPEPPDGCNDPELWTLLAQFEFLRCMRDEHPDDYVKLRDKLTSEIERIVAALDERDPLFRWRAAYFAIAFYRESRIDLALRVLDDADPYVRGQIASHIISIRDPQIEGRLVELATTDPDPKVRGAACRGLAGQDPLSTIPLLVRVLDTDHAAGESGWPVSHFAALALDEMIGTDFMEKRFNGVATFPDEPANPKAVREHALRYLEQLRGEKDK